MVPRRTKWRNHPQTQTRRRKLTGHYTNQFGKAEITDGSLKDGDARWISISSWIARLANYLIRRAANRNAPSNPKTMVEGSGTHSAEPGPPMAKVNDGIFSIRAG